MSLISFTVRRILRAGLPGSGWSGIPTDDAGKMTTATPKPYWQTGWMAQHDRLLTAISAMKGRVPIVVSGDLHAVGMARIVRSGRQELRANPVASVLSGP